LGRQRIATITGPLNTTAGEDRAAGYRNALNQRGLTVDERLVVEGDFTEAGGYFAARRLLDCVPDAVFAASDIMAQGAMRALHERGLRIPEDVAVVGFDDLRPSSRSNPSLTTMRQPIRRLGIKLVETLLDIVENGNRPPRRVIFDTELVIRDSCGSHLVR
jgi:LacI family transcriptional regulator